MSSEIFNRLEGLMKSLALSVEKGSYTRAEMKAYSAGIELAAEKLEEVFKNLFVDTASATGIAMFLSLLCENPAATEDESRKIITDLVSAGRRIFPKSEFDKMVSSLGKITYEVSGNEIRLSLGTAFNRQVFEAITKLIRDFSPSSSIVDSVSAGHSFSQWESLGLHWFELDSYEMPFYIIEKI